MLCSTFLKSGKGRRCISSGNMQDSLTKPHGLNNNNLPQLDRSNNIAETEILEECNDMLRDAVWL